MARYLYCEPCGVATCGKSGVALSRGSGEDAERAVWGVLVTPQMKVGSYTNKGITGRVVVGHVGKKNVVNETVTIEEKTTLQAAPHADLECNACGAMLSPGEKVCAYSLGNEPAWESRYLEGADGS